MRLSIFNLMICSSDRYALIKKPRSIILSFVHQQEGMETIANILILISLLFSNLLPNTTWRSHSFNRLISRKQPLIFAKD